MMYKITLIGSVFFVAMAGIFALLHRSGDVTGLMVFANYWLILALHLRREEGGGTNE